LILSVPEKSWLLNSRQLLSGHREQIGGNDRRQYIGFERTESFPGAACQTETAFEPGYSGLDSGTKAPEFFVNVLAAAHVRFFQTALFGKTAVVPKNWTV
jgi:hypothetical protein